MSKGLEFKGPWAMLKMALLMVLFLTIASGGQTPCNDGDQNCDNQWNLLARDEGASELAFDDRENIADDLNTVNTATIAFDFQNQSSSAEVQNVVTGNDTAKIIKLTAKDINNDQLSYMIVRSPSHGNISGTAPNMIYMPDRDYVGNDSIEFGVIDEMGNLQNITIAIDVLQISHPPSVRILSPSDGDLFRVYPDTYNVQIPIRVVASGGASDIVVTDYPEGTELAGSCPDSVDNCRITLYNNEFFPGTHTLVAKASYSGGDFVTSSPVAITVNPPEPSVTITSPLNGEIFTSPADITITSKVDTISQGNAVNNVEYFENSHRLGSPIENESPYTFVWHDVSPGVYNLVAKATDEINGYTAISESVLVVVAPVKPLSKSDLDLSMISTSNPAPAGGFFNYVLTVTNRGPDSATDVTVEDFLPPELELVNPKASQGDYDSGIWSLGGLTKYRSARLVLTVQAPFEAGPGQIANTAYVYGSEVDPDNSNNHVTTYTRINAGNVSPE
jgi:uncharacterized repeat protein (TIGR01451 family)